MIIYNNIISKLKEAGYSTKKIREEKLLSESTLTSFRNNRNVNLSEIDKVCKLLDCRIEDVVEFKNVVDVFAICRAERRLTASEVKSGESIVDFLAEEDTEEIERFDSLAHARRELLNYECTYEEYGNGYRAVEVAVVSFKEIDGEFYEGSDYDYAAVARECRDLYDKLK